MKSIMHFSSPENKLIKHILYCKKTDNMYSLSLSLSYKTNIFNWSYKVNRKSQNIFMRQLNVTTKPNSTTYYPIFCQVICMSRVRTFGTFKNMAGCRFQWSTQLTHSKNATILREQITHPLWEPDTCLLRNALGSDVP